MISPPNPQNEFLPLEVRRVLYIAGLVSVILAPILEVNFPEYSVAIFNAGIILQGAALGTAIANTGSKNGV